MRYTKYKEKVRTRTGKIRYIYDTVKEGLTSTKEDQQVAPSPTPSDNKKKKEKKKRTYNPKKKEDSKAMKEYKQKLADDAAAYLDASSNPSYDMSMQSYDVKKAAESFKKSKKFKDLL